MMRKGVITETDSKNKKRGRPDVFTRDYGDNALKERAFYENLFPGCGRSLSNMHYVIAGMGIAKDTYGEEKTKSMFTFPSGNFKGACILEQIGRMRLQDGYSDDDCASILQVAMILREDGMTAKTVAQWIRNGRMTGEW